MGKDGDRAWELAMAQADALRAELRRTAALVENLTARNDLLEACRTRERAAIQHLLEKLDLEFRVVAGIEGIPETWVADVNAAWLGACHVPLDEAHARILIDYVQQEGE